MDDTPSWCDWLPDDRACIAIGSSSIHLLSAAFDEVNSFGLTEHILSAALGRTKYEMYDEAGCLPDISFGSATLISAEHLAVAYNIEYAGLW